MNHKHLFFFLLLSLVLSGCTNLYRYRSDGEVISVTGVKHHAVLYWYGEEGRLWYGKKYAQQDSSVQMRICNVGPKVFDLNKKTKRLELPAKANDLRIRKLDAQGKLQPVDPPTVVGAGSDCGEILLDGKAATTRQLKLAQKPKVVIMCKSIRNPDRYPRARVYVFGSISRTEASNNERKAPDACVAP